MKKYLLLFIISLLIASCGESPEAYNKRALSISDSIITMTDRNFALASDCQTSWRSIIFDHEYISPILHRTSYCSDFNEGLQRYAKDIAPLDSMFKARKKQVTEYFKQIKEYPDESKELFGYIKELVSIYNQSYDMAFEPSGSLQTYTNNLNELYQKYKDVKSKIKIEADLQ
jgi:hypothetical protein